MGFLQVIKKSWFLIGIVLVISLAKLQPSFGSKGGILRPEITVKYIAVFVIFFNSGISLKSEDLSHALLQFRMHLFIQGFTFIIFPLLISAAVFLLRLSQFSPLILEGLLILSCMPPPVSSAVILTKAVGGNEAAAIFNSAFGSFLGIVVTPTLILFLVGSKAEVPVISIFLQLSSTVVLPLMIGQIFRKQLKSHVDLKNIPFGQIGSAVLLLIIYTTFCDTFAHEDIDIGGPSLVLVIFMIFILQCVLLYSIYFISSRNRMKFTRADTVALMFCCTHKSLTLGIPIIKIVFAGYKGMSLITIPLLIYHPTQILLGGVLVPYIRQWMVAGQKTGSHLHSSTVV